MNEFTVRLDLAKGKARQQQTVFVRQGDKNATTIVATITDHGAAASTSGMTARFSMRLPNGTEYYRKAASLSGNVATVALDEAQAASVAGRTDVAYFQLLQGSTVVASTESFTVVVLPDALADADVAESYDSAIQDAIDALDDAVADMPDMVEDVLTDHPEWTTTVQDGSITQAKLATDLARDRERLLYRLANLLTAALPEGDVATATDAAQTPAAGLALYGRSTQDGTPTPSAPVPIVSVGGNLLDPSTFVARGGGADVISGGFVSDSTPTADYSGWTWAHRTFDVTLPAGTYTVCFCVRAQGRSSSGYAVVTEAGATIVSPTSGFAPSTFTLGETTNVGIKIKTYEAVVACMVFGGTLTANPSAYVPYGHVGLWAWRTSDASDYTVTPIDLDGHELRSLPDGTRDEVTVGAEGHVTLVQRVQLTTQAVTDGVTGTVGVDVMSSTGEIANGATVLYALATPVTHDLGTVPLVPLVGPDLTAQAVPSAPFALTYERDLNATLARLESAIATLA